jgi:transglutaminase-like putative cysteine protease
MNIVPFPLIAFESPLVLVLAMRMSSIQPSARPKLLRELDEKKFKSIGLALLMLLSTIASIEFVSFTALAATDQDGDGLTYGLEYLINTQPNDWDSDNDQLPDGWEWQYGLDPLSSSNSDGAIGDPDGDGFSNLQEYNYLQPSNWDLSSSTSVLDNGVWWNGTVPVNNWDEENAMQYNQLACGDAGSDGTGSVILCDEDPVGNICTDGIDNDKDGMVDSGDNDFDGDADCSSNDDDGDGIIDEDPMGWDTDGDGMPDGWEASNGLNATSASNADGYSGDPDGDGLINIFEYINPSWTTTCGGQPCYRPGPTGSFTETTTPCSPHLAIGPGGCATLTAETDGVTSTNPLDADTDNDGLNDSHEALTLLTDPTNSDTDADGINDGVEVNGQYGNPAQPSDPRDNNTDGDAFDDGEEDKNGNGIVDTNETDPTRREDSGDFDNDGLENWQENLSCTLWNVADTDFGGVNDGDEANASHGTDPCDSLIQFSTTVVSYSAGSSQLTVSSGVGFSPSGGIAYYNNSGVYTQFSYGGQINGVLQGVFVQPPSGATDVESRNNSWCHDITGGSFPTYCDDDYSDSDGDGLADWEETLGTYGYFSNPTLQDSDGDGVNDYDEVNVDTDPLQPCHNTLDDDGDGLNNYFEITTGCDNSWIGITNGSQDIWTTDENVFDTDAGGVNDKQEYFDSTNPESDPTDDVLPDDYDGDRIPDAIENQTGTDWRNPDTDGGGMLDGDECPQQFWFTNCVGAPFNPFDPSDDVIQNEVIFWANNTSGVVDLNRQHLWRLHTYDFYTGAAYGLETDSHPATEINIPYTNNTHLASSNYANDTVAWNIAYSTALVSGMIPMPAYQFNVTFWSDADVAVTRTNDTHTYEVTSGVLDSIWLEQYEYWYDWDTLSANTVAGTNSSYELTLPQEMSNTSLPESVVLNITNEVISAAGATDAYSKAEAIATFLRDGNASYDFKRNYNGSGIVAEADISVEMLTVAKEGTCSEFTTVFVTMARVAGLPARFVTGYRGGSWTGNGYEVYGADLAQWGEVRLEMSQGSGGDDLGWIPFDACPAPEAIEIVNMTWSPTNYERGGTAEVVVTGTLQYTDNATAIPGITLRGFVVSAADAGNVPGSAAELGNLFGSIDTDSNGNFTLNGTLVTPVQPGYSSIVIEHIQREYVSHDGIDLGVFINMTDDSNLSHSEPGPVDSPVLGAGATTVLSGQLLLESNETYAADSLGDLTVWLDFVSSVDGATNISGDVGPGGFWAINVSLDELEAKTNISGTLGFSGWQDTSQAVGGPQFHLRPTTHSITMDIRDAPNLTAVIEGPGSNNSIMQIDELVYINGSALSFGASPAALSGNLSFGMRELNGGGTFVELFNKSVNGAFSIAHVLAINDTTVKAGGVDLELVFYPDSLEATDSLNTSGTPWWLQGILSFELQALPQVRGDDVGIIVLVTDHLGGSFELNLIGSFTFDFNGSTVNTTTDPDSSTMSPTFATNANLFAGDYDFEMAFVGNDYFMASSNTSLLRIMGTVDITVTVIDDWTYLGNTTWVIGDFTDAVHGTAVLANDSIVMVQLVTPTGVVEIAQGALNNSTGTYNISISAPNNFPSGVYDLEVMSDFTSVSQDGGAYFDWVPTAVPPALPQMPSTTWGIESDAVLAPAEGTPDNIIAVMNSNVEFKVRVSDVADNSNVSGAQVNYIMDYGGANISIGNAVSAADGNATFTWNVSGVDPGLYVLRMEVADDLSSPKIAGATRHRGNFTEINVTVQVPSNLRIDSIPSTVTAGFNFQVVGQVEDGDNVSRNLTSPVALEMFWLDNPDEKLINGVYTAVNGSFNLSVPTDVLSNGTLRGPRTFIISVVEDSSPFYLTDTSNHSILVQGVTLFENIQPLNPMIVNRGETINMSVQMVESSNMYQPLGGYTIDTLFDATWLPSNTTDSQGRANFTYAVPFDQPLGMITISIMYNGSFDLLSTQTNLSTVTIRSTTVMVVDPIVSNPVAGESFTITGSIASDNGSALQLRNGAPLTASVLFTIDDQATGFTQSNVQILPNGTWAGTIMLGSTFSAGTHIAEAQYIPSVNYYSGSSANQSFDSRGFTTLTFVSPTLDGVDQPSLNDRTDRGDDINARLQLFDNTGAPVVGVQVTVSLNGTPVTITGTTDANGLIDVNLTIPATLSVGFHDLDAEFTGTPGTTGLIGDTTDVTFIVLGNTEITIDESSSAITAGDVLYVNGTLLDDLGSPLQIDGVDSIAVVYLLIDGVPVSSVQSNASDGKYMFAWTSPESIEAGQHNIQISFTGGRDWVDPIGEGDSANPDFYKPSSSSVNFTVAVPTKILLLTTGGQVDREDTLTVQGRLLDIVDNPLEGETIEIWLGGVFLTNVTTTADGSFNAVHPVPADAELGPVVLETRYMGSLEYLPSTNDGTWNIYSKIIVQVNIESPLAVDQLTTVDGFVGDNLLNPLSDMLVLVTVEGIPIGNATTDANGNFSFNWQVPNIFTDGTHTVVADVPAQGWYRSGQGNTTFFLSHRTGMTVDFVDNDATRDDFWEISGSLYDIDTAQNDGLPGETIFIYLDGAQVGYATTTLTGDFTASIRADSAYARGSHVMRFAFDGSTGHLPVDANETVLVWAEVNVNIDSIQSYDVVRSDSTTYKIQITGRVTEIGGQGVLIDGATLVLGNGINCGSSGVDSRCINIDSVIWNGGTFTLSATAPSWIEPGQMQFNLQTPENSSLYLRSGNSWTEPVSVRINLKSPISVDIEDVIEGEQEVLSGEIELIADDTEEGVEGIAITVYLESANNTRLDEVVIVTDSDGIASFEFNSDPPYGDTSEYGELTLKIQISPNYVISDGSMNEFNTLYSSGISPDYTYEDDSSGAPWWLYLVAILLIGAGAAFVIMRRRATEAAKEIADIFSYTAELLAAGDSMREAIFQCYESLVHILMGRGFLRRDFETVREFEMAIRAALPNITEESLSLLDNVFEEARYSRHEMGESHKINAQEALTRVVGEIGQLGEIPNR